MAIGSTINTTALTAGATAMSMTKTQDGTFAATLSGDMVRLTMKAVDPFSKKRRLSLTLKTDPSLMDAPSSATSGKINVMINVDFTPGSDVTDMYIKSRIVDLASVCIQDAVISALLAGSYE